MVREDAFERLTASRKSGSSPFATQAIRPVKTRMSIVPSHTASISRTSVRMASRLPLAFSLSHDAGLLVQVIVESLDPSMGISDTPRTRRKGGAGRAPRFLAPHLAADTTC